MIRHISIPRVLVVVGIVLLVAPALVPVQPILYHETRMGTTGNGTQIQSAGVEIIAYENLSERGQQLYVETLRNGGSYTVQQGAGASDFEYVSAAEEADDPRQQRLSGSVAIERPPDADLPPADEPVGAAERERRRASEQAGNETGNETENATDAAAERRAQIARYDLMSTRTDSPPLTDGSNLVRLLSAVLGVVGVSVGGYLTSRP